MSKKIIIIGAGLSGLSLGYFLKKEGLDFQILEAGIRIGGRIKTIKSAAGTPIEMGATWLGRKHKHLVEFLKEIGVEIFQQYIDGVTFFETMSFTPPQKFVVPKTEEPSFRIKGGTHEVISRLAENIGSKHITVNQRVKEISKKENKIQLITSNGFHHEADLVISTLPPKLFAHTIMTHPALPDEVTEVLKNTQTWMENSIKFAVEYSRPFWREKNYSGAVFSQSSLIPEMYDHTNFEGDKFALKGFLNGSVIHFSKEKREQAVIQNLKKFFGSDAENYSNYFENIWEQEPFTFSPSEKFLTSHLNNGHPFYQKSYWENTLYFAGTETSSEFGGYMEGAIQSSKRVANQIIQVIKK